MSFKAVKFYLIHFLILFLTACSSGSSDGTPSPDQVAGDSAKLTLRALLSDGQSLDNIKVGESLVLQAQLTLPSNLPIRDHEIQFSTEQGTLSSSARLTDDKGQAQVTFDSTGLTAGVISITATTTYLGETITFVGQFELQSAAAAQPAILTLTVLNQSGQETISITQGNQLSINANLVSSTGTAIAQQAVNFTATAGSFSATSRLTTSSGLATVNYDSAEVNPAVITVTATTTHNGTELSVSKQFEVLQAVAENVSPSLNVTFKQDGLSVNRIQAGETAQVGVELKTSSGEPIANTIVNFTADLGSLMANSALTDNQGIAEVTLSGSAEQLGAGLATASATVNNVNISNSVPYEVVNSDVITDTSLKLGYLDNQGNFQAGIKSKLTNSNAESTISAGGTLGLELSVFNQNNEIFTAPLTISFTSTCVANSTARLDTSVTTINGIASATFEDVSCATRIGNSDTIVASITVNSSQLTATHNIKIQPEALGSVEFVSASPQSIVIKGTGGQGKQETSTLTFRVRGELNNPLADQPVNFSLNTDVGGLSLASASGITNSQGLVSAKVISGTVPTAVRVTAVASVAGGNTISTQSDLLSVNTGLPDQNSMTLALSQINPEAFNIVGVAVTVSAYMADSFNNPVPDGTTINFTTEGGSITPSCNTTSGRCSVTWTSQEPRIDNHRVTILATAIGHESFVDRNGNNLFDSTDGTARSSSVVSSGFGRLSNLSSGFIDMSEAWRDDNENNVRDSNELFIDSVRNQKFDGRDGLFNGPQCQGSLCSTNKSVIVRKSTVLITSSSRANYRVASVSNNNLVYASSSSSTTNSITISRGGSTGVNIRLSDTANQTLAVGTTVNIAAEGATLVGSATRTINNTIGAPTPNSSGEISFNIVLLNQVTTPSTGSLTITVTSPSGVITEIPVVITLQ